MRVFVLFATVVIFMTNGFAQDIPDGYKKVNNFLVPVELLDPSYPVYEDTGMRIKDYNTFIEELQIYTKRLGCLPEYHYTGDVISDQTNFEEAIRLFLQKHPYFPQPVFTNDPDKDEAVFECLWKGYFRYFPVEAKKIIILEEEGGIK